MIIIQAALLLALCIETLSQISDYKGLQELMEDEMISGITALHDSTQYY